MDVWQHFTTLLVVIPIALLAVLLLFSPFGLVTVIAAVAIVVLVELAGYGVVSAIIRRLRNL